MTKTKAWSTMQGEVSAYARRLELMDRQMNDLQRYLQRLSTWIQMLGSSSLFAMLMFTAWALAETVKLRRPRKTVP
ncbi:MAG: hypothetical protein ABFE01_26150 [Phycisphaerales bacterium]